jgi:hypothetical protein
VEARIKAPDVKLNHTVALAGAVVVSVVVMIEHACLSVLLLLHAIPEGSREAALILLGSTGSMAMAVVGYWVGSSIGSLQKNALLREGPP